MRRFAITLTSKGQVTLPAEYRRMVGAKAGDRLALVVDEDGRGVLTRSEADLSAIHRIVEKARAEACPGPATDDPVGDLLVADDERIRRRG